MAEYIKKEDILRDIDWQIHYEIHYRNSEALEAWQRIQNMVECLPTIKIEVGNENVQSM